MRKAVFHFASSYAYVTLQPAGPCKKVFLSIATGWLPAGQGLQCLSSITFSRCYHSSAAVETHFPDIFRLAHPSAYSSSSPPPAAASQAGRRCAAADKKVFNAFALVKVPPAREERTVGTELEGRKEGERDKSIWRIRPALAAGSGYFLAELSLEFARNKCSSIRGGGPALKFNIGGAALPIGVIFPHLCEGRRPWRVERRFFLSLLPFYLAGHPAASSPLPFLSEKARVTEAKARFHWRREIWRPEGCLAMAAHIRRIFRLSFNAAMEPFGLDSRWLTLTDCSYV